MFRPLIIVGLSTLLIGCKPEQTIEKNLSRPELARSVLMNTKSISFKGNDFGTDGGTLVYIFQTDRNERLEIRIKVQLDENDNLVDVTDSSQPILIGLKDFMRKDDMYTLEHNSEEEKQLLLLISHSSGEEYDPLYSKIRTNLTELIEVRNFPWSEFGPRPKTEK